jgi:hypothetical protein
MEARVQADADAQLWRRRFRKWSNSFRGLERQQQAGYDVTLLYLRVDKGAARRRERSNDNDSVAVV